MSLILNNKSLFDLFDVFDNQLTNFPNSKLFNNNNFDLVPPIDLVEKEEAYELRASLPGSSNEKINIDFNKEKNELKISGEVPETNVVEENENSYYKEIKSGSFERIIRFQHEVDEDAIAANYKNGVLEINVPKLEVEKTQPKVRRIKVGGAEKKSE